MIMNYGDKDIEKTNAQITTAMDEAENKCKKYAKTSSKEEKLNHNTKKLI